MLSEFIASFRRLVMPWKPSSHNCGTATVMAVAFGLTGWLVWQAFNNAPDNTTSPRSTAHGAATVVVTDQPSAEVAEEQCRTILRSPTAGDHELSAAVTVLARQQRKPALATLLDLAARCPCPANQTEVQAIVRLLAAQNTEPCSWRPRLQQLISGTNPSGRLIGLAVRMMIDHGSTDLVSELSDAQNEELVQAVQLLPPGPLHEKLYADFRQICQDKGRSNAVRQAACCAAAALEVDAEKIMDDLINDVNNDQSAPAALMALARISDDRWPQSRTGHVAAAVIAWLARSPVRRARSSAGDARIYSNAPTDELIVRIADKLDTKRRARFLTRIQQLKDSPVSAD